MTMPLYESLKKDEKVHIKVDEFALDRYYPEFLHDFVGKIWDIDEEYIYVIGTKKLIDGRFYTYGPHRYYWGDITLEKVR